MARVVRPRVNFRNDICTIRLNQIINLLFIHFFYQTIFNQDYSSARGCFAWRCDVYNTKHGSRNIWHESTTQCGKIIKVNTRITVHLWTRIIYICISSISLSTLKTAWLDYNKHLKNNSVRYVHIKTQKSISRYRANYSVSKEQAFHHTETDKLQKSAKILNQLGANEQGGHFITKFEWFHICRICAKSRRSVHSLRPYTWKYFNKHFTQRWEV